MSDTIQTTVDTVKPGRRIRWYAESIVLGIFALGMAIGAMIPFIFHEFVGFPWQLGVIAMVAVAFLLSIVGFVLLYWFER